MIFNLPDPALGGFHFLDLPKVQHSSLPHFDHRIALTLLEKLAWMESIRAIVLVAWVSRMGVQPPHYSLSKSRASVFFPLFLGSILPILNIVYGMLIKSGQLVL